MIRRRPRQRVRIAGEDLLADSGQPFPENLADVGMPPGAADDPRHAVAVNVADRELVEVAGEAAAGFHVAARVDDQRLTGALAVVLLEPGAVPAAGKPLGTFDRREVVP